MAGICIRWLLNVRRRATTTNGACPRTNHDPPFQSSTPTLRTFPINYGICLFCAGNAINNGSIKHFVTKSEITGLTKRFTFRTCCLVQRTLVSSPFCNNAFHTKPKYKRYLTEFGLLRLLELNKSEQYLSELRMSVSRFNLSSKSMYTVYLFNVYIILLHQHQPY